MWFLCIEGGIRVVFFTKRSFIFFFSFLFFSFFFPIIVSYIVRQCIVRLVTLFALKIHFIE